jgi:hypothetical protein
MNLDDTEKLFWIWCVLFAWFLSDWFLCFSVDCFWLCYWYEIIFNSLLSIWFYLFVCCILKNVFQKEKENEKFLKIFMIISRINHFKWYKNKTKFVNLLILLRNIENNISCNSIESIVIMKIEKRIKKKYLNYSRKTIFHEENDVSKF